MNNNYTILKPIQIIIIIILSSLNFTYGQNWTDNLPEKKIKKNNLNFNDFQKAFYETYPKDVITNGKFDEFGNHEMRT